MNNLAGRCACHPTRCTLDPTPPSPHNASSRRRVRVIPATYGSVQVPGALPNAFSWNLPSILPRGNQPRFPPALLLLHSEYFTAIWARATAGTPTQQDGSKGRQDNPQQRSRKRGAKPNNDTTQSVEAPRQHKVKPPAAHIWTAGRQKGQRNSWQPEAADADVPPQIWAQGLCCHHPATHPEAPCMRR